MSSQAHSEFWRRRATAVGLAWLLAAPLAAQISFTDVSSEAGLAGDLYKSTTYHSLGVNWIDYDNDDRPDLFLVGGNPVHGVRLFHNQGDGTFTAEHGLIPELPDHETSGSVFGDYDNDGDTDIFIYTDNPVLDPENNPPDGPPNLLLKNLWIENGQRILPGAYLFEEVSVFAGVEDLAEPPLGPLPGYRAKTAGWLDYDRDGCLDLYVGHWVMNGGSGNAGNADRLYRNRCDGTFEDATAAAGLDPGGVADLYRPTLAMLGAHMDDDLWPEIYAVHASNDGQPIINDFLFANNGDGTFTERTAAWPHLGNDAQAGMGIDVADVDLDGDWDLYISDLRFTDQDQLPKGNVLYRGNGDGTFADNSALESGVQGHNSWGVSFADFDLDGDEDLFVGPTSSAEFEMLYENDGTGLFTNVATAAGIVTSNVRGSATADFDGDGDLDLAVVNEAGSLQLFRNDTPAEGNWLMVQLTGTVGNRDAIGAVVELRAGSLTLKRQVKGGSSAHSQDALAVHFGLGDQEVIDELRIRWPSGLEDVLTEVPVNRSVPVMEGMSTPISVSINAGGPELWSAAGAAYLADRRLESGGFGFVRGWTKLFSEEVAGTEDDQLYLSMRTRSSFGYRFEALPAGFYEVVLHFLEPTFSTAGSRVFDVLAEGVERLNDFDIHAAAGGALVAHSETFVVEVLDGALDLDFQIVIGGKAVVSALTVREVGYRLNSGGDWHRAQDGGAWAGDRRYRADSFGYRRGWKALFEDPIEGTEDDAIFQSMRTRKLFSYHFDRLPAGVYEVELRFTEPFHASPGGRLIDVAAEGVPVIENLDIFAVSGGLFRAHTETFSIAIEDGDLDLEFAVDGPGKAIVSGISVQMVGQP